MFEIGEEETDRGENESRRALPPNSPRIEVYLARGLRLTPRIHLSSRASPQESQRCRPMRFGILEPFQATFE